MRDSQRQRAYRWEHAFRDYCETTRVAAPRYLTEREVKEYRHEIVMNVESEPLHNDLIKPRSEKECRELVYKLREQGLLKFSPILTFKERGPCHYTFWKHEIQLARWGMDFLTVTHEMCHAIIDRHLRMAIDVAPHGREFVGLMMHFLERNHNVDRRLLAAMANKHRVDFTTLSPKDLVRRQQRI